MRLDLVINDFVRDKEQEKALNLSPRPVVSGDGGREYLLLQKKKILGLDIAKGLRRLGDNAESYITILRSYVNNTPALLNVLRDLSTGNLALYAVTVHGLKGSSHGICAEAVGKKAKELEDAAKAGNLDFIKIQNAAFIEMVESLMQSIGDFLKDLDENEQKPVKDAPDPELLAAILKASGDYDMDALDQAITELEQYRYKEQGELVDWLREQLGRSAFEEIEKRLEGARLQPQG
jgi:HPt (histidine-containing phosphotransfer) domain-containing protein